MWICWVDKLCYYIFPLVHPHFLQRIYWCGMFPRKKSKKKEQKKKKDAHWLADDVMAINWWLKTLLLWLFGNPARNYPQNLHKWLVFVLSCRRRALSSTFEDKKKEKKEKKVCLDGPVWLIYGISWHFMSFLNSFHVICVLCQLLAMHRGMFTCMYVYAHYMYNICADMETHFELSPNKKPKIQVNLHQNDSDCVFQDHGWPPLTYMSRHMRT